MIALSPMTADDLPQVGRWLREPHVARWWTPDPTIEAELAKYRGRLADDSRVRMRTILELADGAATPIGSRRRQHRLPPGA